MTNKQIIEVVQAAEAGKQIETRLKGFNMWARNDVNSADWDFQKYEYRVAVEPREFKLIWWPGEECTRGICINGRSGWHVYNGASHMSSPDWKVIQVREIIEQEPH